SEVEKPTIKLTLTVLKKINLLMQEYANLEWAADLLGHKDETKNEIVISDIVVFKQEVDVASVVRTEYTDIENLIGVIHSHHSMQNKFSHIDDEFVNSNHDLSAVVSFAESPFGTEINITYRVKTQCEKFVRHNDLSWMLDYVFVDFDEGAFIAGAKEKIVERVGLMSKDGYFDLMYDFPFEFSASKRSKSLSKPEILSIEDELAELYGESESKLAGCTEGLDDFCEQHVRMVRFADGFYICKPDGDLIKADAHAIELLIESEEAHEISADEWLIPAEADETILKSVSDIPSIQ
ncbi:MAG: hypothetical protein KAR20_16790, partial [Candidatus Heimdallarchaeota archaeon]|nr:hypothetical protein [Candidatus Heimdallarchaeota archaeon]